MMCRSIWGSMLSLSVSHEAKSLFLGVCWHEGWLAVPDRRLSSKVEENSSAGVFSNTQNPQVSKCDA